MALNNLADDGEVAANFCKTVNLSIHGLISKTQIAIKINRKAIGSGKNDQMNRKEELQTSIIEERTWCDEIDPVRNAKGKKKLWLF